MQSYHTSITLMGEVSSVNTGDATFVLSLLTGKEIPIHVTTTTYYEVLRNIGDEWRDRVREPSESDVVREIGTRSEDVDPDLWDVKSKLLKYLKPQLMVCIQGVRSEEGDDVRYSACRVVLMHSEPGHYGWEDTHWWLQQINTLFEQWLDVLFDTRREFTENDFSECYRTNLNLVGGTTGDLTQECATMSRFLYGLSSAYMLTGNERAFSAAQACAKYLVNAFSSPSHDGEYVFWKFGRIKKGLSAEEIIGSLNPDDRGSFALYEQIYALSGLTQYYRITQDTWILDYIVRTIAAFEKFYYDEIREGDSCFTGKGGYYSHIDPVTMRPDSPSLDGNGNREKKNWNSVGDHIPAYLINLLLSIDPIPESGQDKQWKELLALCRRILNRCVSNILKYFPSKDNSLFVEERFDKEWNPDHTWGWQQNRGIVGHNLKISWNLTRCAFYYQRLMEEAKQEGDLESLDQYDRLAQGCYDLALMIGKNMKKVGVDLARGGIYDALERCPANGLATQFAWSSTKDFWQQEQAILAYYIMHSVEHVGHDDKNTYLQLARYCAAFWSLFFVDHDHRKIYFRTTESGEPIIEGQYGRQGGHAIAGYHAFELNYLVHQYIRTFVGQDRELRDHFVLYFRPKKSHEIKTLNVMPDFYRPGDLAVSSVRINGILKEDIDPQSFQIDISELPTDSVVMVEYFPMSRSEYTLKDLKMMSRQGQLMCRIGFPGGMKH